ncbi:FxSxx-COOH cyclophane-containing RiPP peptide [Streptomyces sp. NPDC001315]|uniref:FxSxx-COOH cyclophane-containing RiPP peptide n=1 Tax=Streptomyces sp. NPDC001315 TaxID=3364562 RepID=UPI0036B991F0
MAAAEGVAPGEARTGGGGEPAPDVESVVLDLTVLAPEDVAALPESVLGAVLRRVYAGCAEGDPFVTGHKESA